MKYRVEFITFPDGDLEIRFFDTCTYPLLYAAMRAIEPRQRTEEETKNTAGRVFQNNPGLTSTQIGKAIGHSRQTVDSYIADLRAAIQQELDLKLFRMHMLGIPPQDRITKRLVEARETICSHLTKMPESALWPKAGLSKGFTTSHVAQKHCWTEPMGWAFRLEGKRDLEKFKQYYWDMQGKNLPEILKAREKPNLIIFDLPYFSKKTEAYRKEKISTMSKQEYLKFFEK